MRVSLAAAHAPTPRDAEGRSESVARPLLASGGPRVVLGGELGDDGLARPIAPAADTLFGPRGACLASPGGPLFVCDTGHHRLLVWTNAPMTDGAPADLLIGQSDFSREGRNAKGEVGAATLNVPTGVAAENGVLAVADAWNHRVLLWHGYPHTANQPADVVLGQADFAGGQANRGADRPRADTLNWCYGVALAQGRLIVADTGNRRVLVWGGVPEISGASADLVMGQRDFVTRDENAGEGGGPLGMRWPHGLTASADAILVSDAGNNRIMAWRRWPTSNGGPCDFVLGQPNIIGLDHNGGAYYPTARTLSMPYGLTAQGDRVIVADTANSRLVGFDRDALAIGGRASRLAGQEDFTRKGDNRWGPPVRDSLCWPYGVAANGKTLIVADSGNSRVLFWEVAP
ncbi:MAG: NHL repeat-containing protein [Pseudomonadota bacterium]